MLLQISFDLNQSDAFLGQFYIGQSTVEISAQRCLTLEGNVTKPFELAW